MTPYYEHAGITIYCGDCREILPSLYGFQLVLTDPPYGIGHESNYGASWRGTSIDGDGSIEVRDAALAMLQRNPMIVFGSWKTLRPSKVKQVLIWDKGPAFGMGDLTFPWKNSFEEIYIIGEGFNHARRDQAVIRGHVMTSWETVGHRRQHPNEKPVSLLKYLLQRHPCGCIIDPFMGSGSSLQAAKEDGRSAIGIEIEERYCEIAAKRLSQEVLEFA